MSTKSQTNTRKAPFERAFLKHYATMKPPPHPAFRREPESDAVAKALQRKYPAIQIKFITPEEMERRPPRDLSRNDLVVGDMAWIRKSLHKLDIPMPQAPDFPDCLKDHLHRKIWETSLGEVAQIVASPSTKHSIFIKPATDAKLFNGLLCGPGDMMLPYVVQEFGRDVRVVCSEVVNMISEYRAYSVRGVVKAIAQYMGPKASRKYLDEDVIRKAAATLFKNRPDLIGCGLDFAVVKRPDGSHVTALIEVNDGYALGKYEGISDEDYAEMIVERWKLLMKTKVRGRSSSASHSDETVDASKVRKLMDLGYTRAKCELALSKSRGNTNVAGNMLLSRLV